MELNLVHLSCVKNAFIYVAHTHDGRFAKSNLPVPIEQKAKQAQPSHWVLTNHTLLLPKLPKGSHLLHSFSIILNLKKKSKKFSFALFLLLPQRLLIPSNTQTPKIPKPPLCYSYAHQLLITQPANMNFFSSNFTYKKTANPSFAGIKLLFAATFLCLFVFI